jgi:hypothetical protein
MGFVWLGSTRIMRHDAAKSIFNRQPTAQAGNHSGLHALFDSHATAVQSMPSAS